jgi:hypothetical protein
MFGTGGTFVTCAKNRYKSVPIINTLLIHHHVHYSVCMCRQTIDYLRVLCPNLIHNKVSLKCLVLFPPIHDRLQKGSVRIQKETTNLNTDQRLKSNAGPDLFALVGEHSHICFPNAVFVA